MMPAPPAGEGVIEGERAPQTPGPRCRQRQGVDCSRQEDWRPEATRQTQPTRERSQRGLKGREFRTERHRLESPFRGPQGEGLMRDIQHVLERVTTRRLRKK